MEKEFTDLDIINWLEWNDFCPRNGMNFKQVLKKRDELVPFVGSGLSAFVYCSWSRMMLLLSEDLPDNIKQNVADLIEKRQFYAAGDVLRNNISDATLIDMINDVFDVKKIDDYTSSPSKREKLMEQAVYYVPQLLRENRICYTINFDLVLERVFSDQRIRYTSAHPSEYTNIAIATGNRDTILLKLHGSIDSDTINLVIANSDAYVHYANGSAVVNCFETSILQYRLFFLGIGLRGDFIVEKLKEYKSRHPNRPHFAIIPIERGENKEARAKELDSMHVIPLFYTNNDEPGGMGHKWVPIILQWIVDGHNPNEGDLKERIERFKKSVFYKCTKYNAIYNMHSFFQDHNGDFNNLQNFLDMSQRFLWWHIFGPSDSGKTRWMHELIATAQKQNWNSYIYDDSNYDDFNVEYFNNNKNILIIFDDADLYNIETNKNSSNTDAKITFNSFCKVMHRLINMSNRNAMKLRVVFTFTRVNKQNEDSYFKHIKNWWETISNSDQSLANAFESCEFPEDAIELKWTQDDISVFCQNFIRNYADKDDLEKKCAIDYISDLIKKEWGREIIVFTPLICMMYIDAYLYKQSSSVEEILLFFAEYLVKSGKKKSKEDADLFLEKHIKYLTELNEKGKSRRLNIPEKGLKEENTLYDDNVEVQREL